MQKSKFKTKVPHLQKQIRSLQVDIKRFLQSKTMFNNESVGAFTLTRTGTKKGYWEFVNNKYSVVLNAGMKTSTNNIFVVEKASKKQLCFFTKDPRNLKVIQSELLALKKGLAVLPMRHRQNGYKTIEKSSLLIMPKTKILFSLLWDMPEKEALKYGIFFFEKNYTFQETPFVRLEIINEEDGSSFGNLILIKGESPCWFTPEGDDADRELSSILNERLKSMFVAA